MARTVSTGSTFEDWRQKYNDLVTDVGDPTALTTGTKDSLVNAVNYIMDQYFFFQDFDYDGSDGASSNTVFSGVDNAGNTLQYMASKVLVYKNGLLLRSGTDYTAINGTSVTLTSSANNGDVVRISSYTGSYTATPSGQESLFNWQINGANIYNSNTGSTSGVVLNADKDNVAALVTAPTVANSIQLEGDTYINADLYLNAQKDLRFRDADSSHYAAIQAPATISANYTLTLPTDDGTSGQFLETNGSGVLTWGTETTYTAGSGLTLSGTAFSVTNEGITNAHILDNTIGADELNVSGDGGNGYALTSDADGSFSWTQFSGSDTTYTTSWVDDSANAILRLTPSSGSADDLTIVAGSGITVTPSGDNLTIAATAGTPTVITVADTTDTTSFVGLFESPTGDLAPKTDAGITYNAGTGVLTATGFAGPITGNVTGNVAGNLTGNVTGNTSGSSGSTTGNAVTATALATGRTISMSGDVTWSSGSFDGSANISGAGTIANAAVNTAKIQNDSITADKIADNVVNSEHYAAASIDNEHLADNAVDSAELASGAVDLAHLSASGTRNSGTFYRGDGTFAVPAYDTTNTWRTVTAGGNTLSTSETLAFTAGTNVSITESGGAVTITSTDQYTGTSNLALGSSSSTAYRGDRGTTAYDHSQAAHAPSGAEVNVQSDWNSGSGDNHILNKPTIPSNNNQLSNGAGYTTNTGTVTSIATGTGLSGGTITGSGTISVNRAAVSDGATTLVNGNDVYDFVTGLGYTTNTGDVTEVQVSGAGLSIGSGTGPVPVVTWSTANITTSTTNSDGDYFVVHNGSSGSGSQHKLLKGNINITEFNNDGLYSAGTGVGLSGSAFTWAGGTNLTADANGGSLDAAITLTSVSCSGDITSNTSDARLKDVLGTIENPLEKLSKINGYEFTWNETAKSLKDNTFDDEIQVGVLAQELEEVLPSVIKPAAFEGYKTVQYEKIVPLLIESIKELQKEVESLKDSKT